MSGGAPFPLADGRTKGYERRAVDAFLGRARGAFETAGGIAMTAEDVRRVAFPLVASGYDIATVDAALGRLEDAFAAREREARIAQHGVATWVREARTDAQVILERLTRPHGERFRRAGVLTYGYRCDEVDLVADKLVRYLRDGEPVTAEQVRAAAFRMQRNGYAEEQVDALLDGVVEVMLAVTSGRA
ncbi:DivIVA domain-containing protein [Microbacterium gorillae]|uniref:DivIVA domain-containing protein n=1 Tax=Microbacterium gorillae TaxID=1231063 RepID=UPI00058F7854|nr:DivIVA domain-containing protein [Microbacterium gorillae]